LNVPNTGKAKKSTLDRSLSAQDDQTMLKISAEAEHGCKLDKARKEQLSDTQLAKLDTNHQLQLKSSEGKMKKMLRAAGKTLANVKKGAKGKKDKMDDQSILHQIVHAEWPCTKCDFISYPSYVTGPVYSPQLHT